MKPGPELAELERAEFAGCLAAVSPVALEEGAVDALFVHYRELRRWNRSLSLIGPGTVAELFERHYGEALAGVPLVDAGWKLHVDIGSGGGFPGLVLAATVPGLRTVLVEARQRKWTFLQSVARKALLPCDCLNARVGTLLPPGFPDQIDLLTARAVKLPADTLESLASRLSANGRAMFWAGREPLTLPGDWVLEAEWPLPGSENRRILVFRSSRSQDRG